MIESCTIRLTKSRIDAGYLAIPAAFLSMFPTTGDEVSVLHDDSIQSQRFAAPASTSKEARIYGMRSLYDCNRVKAGDVVRVSRLNSEGFQYEISLVEQSVAMTDLPLFIEDSQLEGCDNPEPPRRVSASVSRIVRDTSAAKRLKQKYGWQCQVCAQQLLCWPGTFYIEAHHLRPLGRPHNGMDRFNNMLVLCPNHHALFDFGVPRFLSDAHVEISGHGFELMHRHTISPQNVSYYMKAVYRSPL